MKKTRLSFRKSRWQRSDTNEIKPDYNNVFTVLGVLLTELANAAAAVFLTVCAVSVVNTTVSHVRCPYYVYVWLFIFSVISGFINRLTSLDTRKWVRHAINTGLLLVFELGVFIANWQAAEHIKDGFLYVKGRYLEIINVYYGTSFVCPKGDKAFAGAFVGFVSFIVMLLLVTLAVQIKRRTHAHIISNASACGTAVHRQKPRCQRGGYAHAVYTLVSYRRWQRTHSGRI